MSEIANFLVHALALEHQAAERYGELTAQMEENGASELAALFARLGDFSARHATQIDDIARQHQPLPRLQSWQFDWETPLPPEVGDTALTTPSMTITQALGYAIANERRGWEYYNTIALTAADPATRWLAQGFASEEAEHVHTLERWLINHQDARPGNST